MLMYKRIYVLVVLVLIAGTVLAGCTENHGKKVDAKKENTALVNANSGDTQIDYTSDWQDFKERANSRIKANQDRIEIFKAQLRTADFKYKLKYEAKVGILEQRNFALTKKLNEYKFKGKSHREAFIRNFNNDADVIEKRLKRILAKKN